MTKRSRRVFILLSLALLFGDAVLVGLGYYNTDKVLQQSLEEQGEKLRAAYEVAYAATLSNMLQMATFIANDPHVQQRFLAGKLAVEREGGGAGGEQAQHHRQALLQEVGPAWQRMTDRFDVRQLHFHLGPGSLSFLRVHKPQKYGDRMDDVRHTIVDTNGELRPRTGFETGRVYSGLRGVVPMWAEHEGKRVHVGALEVGTSFSEMFTLVDRQLDVGTAALLRLHHVEENMWQSAINTQFSKLYQDCQCAIEASSRPGLEKILHHYAQRGLSQSPFTDFRSEHLVIGGRHLAVTFWPLFDYYALSRNTGEQVGAILMWRDISDEVAALNRSLRDNIIIALLGFLLLELLLYWSVRMVTRQLESTIAQRTDELDRANSKLTELAQTDELTGLNNRRHFMALMSREVERARRHGKPLTLAMADLDHFKQVNDRFGHSTGDHALQVVASTLRRGSREYDILGRYGGEELMILLPETDLPTAEAVLERLRQAVADLHIESADGERVPLTISIGVTQLRQGDSSDELLDAADKQLYLAKEQGRNRLCSESSAA
jgi:diguanylate cyclase (GGDEF)-like protein